ncbi:AAA-ATPase At2g18193-like [Vigna radiata var. radiata]|uniref:AAA-ATPase At2g18193-like n=1 Tax=Vigna radiata var. radiata TaxID=3916 RepID=A0A1S3VMV7_VIGRR|nr:AAA-ATPase At2g18193-like [Vigna radiata var. radiata]
MVSNMRKHFPSFASASSWFEVYATLSTFTMLIRTAFNELIPHQIRSFLVSKLEAFFHSQPNNQISLRINEFWHDRCDDNELFLAALEYLPTRITSTYKSLKVGKLENEKHLNLAVDPSQEVVDEFEGTKFTWKLDENSEENSRHIWKEAFVLTFDERNRERVLDRYIPHVLKTYEAMKSEKRIPEIHSRRGYQWTNRKLSHPATFDTLALDPELKQAVVDDLDRFLKRKEFYKKVGKPWKRGYLLYGPPGTGKSSLIAAIANHLKFDVYDLDLSSINSDSDLMEAMRDISRSSILVIEDIDCNEEVHDRSNPKQDSDIEKGSGKFNLSNLLNLVDGLRSGGGDGWVIIFTTNHKEKIDPALLRPGRMDMHIHLSFLKGKAFQIMASKYLGIEGHHPVVEEIKGMLEKTQVTPAVVGEHLIRNEDPDLALEALVQFLKQQIKEETQ